MKNDSSSKPSFGLTEALLCLLVLIVAGGLRVGYVVGCAASGNHEGPLQVQDALPPEMEALIRNIGERSWFGTTAPLAAKEEPTAHLSPGYPWLVGTLSRFADPTNLLPILTWIQCFLGAVTPLLYFLFALRAFNSRLAATLAGLCCAGHPFWVVAVASLGDGVLASFLLGCILYFGGRAAQTAGAFSSLLFGLSLAGLVLVRAPALAFGLPALMWFLWHCRSLERGWLCALLAFLGFANGLVPWGLRNVWQLGEPMAVVDSAWLHLYAGNNLRSTGGPQSEAVLLQELARRRGQDENQLREALARLPQPRRYASLAPDTLGEIRDYPARFLQRRSLALLCFLTGEAWLTGGNERPLVRRTGSETDLPSWLEASQATLFGGALLLMYLLAWIGWRWTYVWRKETALAALAVLWLPLPYLLSHAGQFHGPRLPLDGVLLTLAGFVAACLWPPTARMLLAGPTSPKSKEQGRG